MIATLNNQWIYFDNLTTVEEDVLWDAFSVIRPGVYIDPSQRSGNWDGIYRKYNRGQQRVARPFLSMLRGICQKHNLPLSVRDTRPSWPYHVIPPDQIGPDFLPGITLDDYQIQCLQRAVQCEVGVIDIPTGGGKGELIAGLCMAISCPTLVLADQQVVVKQLKDRLELRDVAEKIGVFYAGKRPNGEAIVVGTIQSVTSPTKPPDIPNKKSLETDEAYAKRMALWEKRFTAYKTRRANAKKLQKYVRRAEMLIVDECDLATSDPWKTLFRYYFTGRRRYGFSGTPFDPDKPVQGLVMQEHLGSVIFRETRAKLTSLNRIIPCEYYTLAYGLDGDITEGSAYDIAFTEHITDSSLYHQTIARLCRRCKRDPQDGTLILVDRERLGHNLVAAIAAQGLSVKFIFGKTRPRQRDKILREFEQREIDVLIGGKIINRGLDLRGGCESLIIATAGKLQSGFIQKIGRAVRHNHRGISRVYGFFFRCNRYLYDHSKVHLKAMIQAGYPTKVVFPGGSVDGAELVKSRFHIRRRLLTPAPSPGPGAGAAT